MPKPGGIEFRVATPADAPCVGVLAMQVFLDTYAKEGVRPDLAREALTGYGPAAFEPRLRDSSNHFALAERAGHLLAFSECRISPQPPLESLSGGMELVRLYVQRHAQRQGIGASLLAHAERHARGVGAPVLWLTAWTGNENARAFYQARGYTDIGAASHVIEGRAYENRIFRKMIHHDH